MHIEIHIFPDTFSHAPDQWKVEMRDLGSRIETLIEDATVNAKAAALGKTTLLDNANGMIIATVDIRRE